MDVVLRASIIFWMLFLLLRLLGKRELGQMTPFEFVSLIVLGDLVQQAVTHNDYSITAATLAVATFGFWALIFGWVDFRSKRLRKLIDGEPRVLVRDGEVIEAMLLRDKISVDEVFSEMRLAGISSVDQVDWAILETNGKISFIEKKSG
ncbi:MAG: YetF domain-containing protein [Sphingomicrobium sp.]